MIMHHIKSIHLINLDKYSLNWLRQVFIELIKTSIHFINCDP